ncbi:FtsQ-type POTRA domain-containing protein [Pleurocapsales cyanobacterium LEGE 10410]|nr:FtsQ-type POTRA domain-containing protein [Pleurocapsales cyanobacterium LEGE 10410]
MSAFPPPELQHKLTLAKLQKHRLDRISLWRSCFLIACTMGLGFVAALPYWQIKQQKQIQISGRKLVSQDTVYHALSFTYPQFIWTVNGLKLTQKIESIPSVAAAEISRQILPPVITVSLQEKTPVAVAVSQGKVGFLDVHGEWIDREFYGDIDADYSLPKIRVINYQAQYQSIWSKIYQLILLYPELEIDEVEWNQSSNLFVQTKIGRVFLGTDVSRLKQQFVIMAKLQNLPAYLERSEIAYIDLSNPDLSLIQRY